jgi:hypothetical protein
LMSPFALPRKIEEELRPAHKPVSVSEIGSPTHCDCV